VNDAEIRKSFHRKGLRHYRGRRDTLVVDELGLHHGDARADIAVINGRLLGYEIKSDDDVLRRLPGQVQAYSAVFDHVEIITCACHIAAVRRMVPKWWGITLCTRGPRGAIRFTADRRGKANPNVILMSVAKLLWRTEAVEILSKVGETGAALRAPRQVLYERLVELLPSAKLRSLVRSCLRERTNWRCRV